MFRYLLDFVSAKIDSVTKWLTGSADEELTLIEEKKGALSTLLEKHTILAEGRLELEGNLIAADSSRALQKLSTKHNLFILVRESNPHSVNKKINMGAANVFPKPLEIKEKSISVIDLKINPFLKGSDLGFIGCYDPYKTHSDLGFLLASIYKDVGGLKYVPVDVSDVPKTIESLIKLEREGNNPDKRKIHEIISCLKKIESRQNEYQTRLKKTSDENYKLKDDLLYKIDVNVDGKESLRPCIADNDIWEVLAFSNEKEGVSLKRVSDTEIEQIFHLIRGEAAIMHGAHLNWTPGNESEQKINRDVIDKQREEPLIMFFPGQVGSFSIKLDSAESMFKTLAKKPSVYFSKTESITKRESKFTAEEILTKFRRASNERTKYKRSNSTEVHTEKFKGIRRSTSVN